MRRLFLLLVVVLCSPCFAGLVGHWKMDDNGDPNIVLDSIGGNNGVYTDNTTPVGTNTGSTAGKLRTALDLDTDEWIDVGDTSLNIKSITFWCKPDAVITTTDYPIDLDGTNYITIVNGTVTKNGFSSGTQVIYVNGVVGTTVVTTAYRFVVLTSTSAVDTDDLDIGRLESSGYFDGKIDNVMLFDKVLTAAEVKYLYNGGRGRESIGQRDIRSRLRGFYRKRYRFN